MSDELRIKCDRLITAMVGKEWAPIWWSGPNKHFDGEIPEDVFKRTPNEVYDYLLTCAYGGW
jgi:hypothetical protein